MQWELEEEKHIMHCEMNYIFTVIFLPVGGAQTFLNDDKQ